MAVSSDYASFAARDSAELADLSGVREVVDRMVRLYEQCHASDQFSFRILLPRDEKSQSKAKKIGFALQGEFILALRKRNLVPVVQEVKYVHDARHYGWLLASPKVLEAIGKGTRQ